MADIRIPKAAWVVVCDGAKALVLRNDGDALDLDLTVVEALDQPDPPARDLGSDRPGRVYQSHGGARSAVEDTDPHAQAEAAFLADLAHRLDAAAQSRDLGALVLVAPPKALGLLREHLTPAVRAALIAEVPKDLTGLPTAEIARHLAA